MVINQNGNNNNSFVLPGTKKPTRWVTTAIEPQITYMTWGNMFAAQKVQQQGSKAVNHTFWCNSTCQDYEIISTIDISNDLTIFNLFASV
jgi:hypothetical protein